MTRRIQSSVIFITGRGSVKPKGGVDELVTLATKPDPTDPAKFMYAASAIATAPHIDHMAKVIDEVTDEQVAQLAKWGVQNHPSAVHGGYPEGQNLSEWACTGDNVTEARNETDAAANAGELSWAHILQEEHAEAMAECLLILKEGATPERLAALRKELVQVSAVANSWIQSIDRNNA